MRKEHIKLEAFDFYFQPRSRMKIKNFLLTLARGHLLLTPSETTSKSVKKRMSLSLLCPFGSVRAPSMLPERHEVEFNNKGSLWINKGTLILKWLIYTNFH